MSEKSKQGNTIGSYLSMTPAGTLPYIYVVFMFKGYVEITFDFMLECLVRMSNINITYMHCVNVVPV